MQPVHIAQVGKWLDHMGDNLPRVKQSSSTRSGGTVTKACATIMLDQSCTETMVLAIDSELLSAEYLM
jgi:hypothetical protein